MQQYISTTIKTILDKHHSTDNLTLILPSKRAGVFVKEAIKNEITSTSFLPKIISIEEFISDISQVQSIDSIALLFEFYNIYLQYTPKEKIQSFDEFSSWATTLIQDFNEIDRFLIDPSHIFSYIKDIKRIENWFTDENSHTTLTNNYFSFFDYVAKYYKELYKHLLDLKKGYQGMQYREAVNNIGDYIERNNTVNHIFIGFNALNEAEQVIFKKLLDYNIATVYFDLDQFFIDENLASSKFITDYKKKWHYFEKNKFHKIHHSFSDSEGKEKRINIIGIPKNVSQIKQVGTILQQCEHLENTALVLANENLLPIALNSLPKEVEMANITMGYPLKNMAVANFFTLLFKLHKNKSKIGKQHSFYYKDVIAVLNHVNLQNYFQHKKSNVNTVITQYLLKENSIFINSKKIKELAKSTNLKSDLLHYIFSDWDEVSTINNNCILLIDELSTPLSKQSLELVYYKRFTALFQQLENLNTTYGYINSLDSLYLIYKQLLSNESLAFKGEALNGLQIMGMLETRVLDFETLIITSVNEGFLPAGKSNNSFIPFDVKQEVGLPTYHEKDAIFSYHFFRLLSRAKTVHLLYNTETDDFGSGEQSRFITQLEILKEKLPHVFTKTIISPAVDSEVIPLKTILKTDEILQLLQKEAVNGFAPTTLTNYIYNPIAFYNQKVLRIKQLNEVEETIAANTLGNIIHDSLEEFYKPFMGQFLTVDDVVKMKKNSNDMVTRHFIKSYKNGDITRGKNRLSFEVAKQFLSKFLTQEIELLKSGKKLKIINIETQLKTTIIIEGIDFPVHIKGKVDRIDELDGTIRIIDYKTGSVVQRQLGISNWEDIAKDHKHSKAFQVLMYAYMYAKSEQISFENTPIESGIISFKSLNAGFMKVNKKAISTEDITKFETELKHLILEIFNAEIPFTEKENLPY